MSWLLVWPQVACLLLLAQSAGISAQEVKVWVGMLSHLGCHQLHLPVCGLWDNTQL